MVRRLVLKTQQVRTIPVGAAAWPRCRMHGAQTLRDEAVAPTRNPSRRGRRSYQGDDRAQIPRWERPPGREAECTVLTPFPAGPPVLPR